MDGIRRNAPIGKDENRNKYLKTLRYTATAAVIDAVQPIRPVINQLYDPKPGFMYDIDILNQHADHMLKAYRKLADQEKKSRDLLHRYHGDQEGFLSMIRELIKQFNQTTASLLTFDRTFHTLHSEALSDILARRQFRLELMGIHIVGINQLEFDGAYFRKAVRENPDFFLAVFQPGLELFDVAFGYIQRIRIPK